MTDKKVGIYLHIPFCMRKCNYCDFCSFPLSDPIIKDEYISALKKHILTYKRRLDSRVADSVYFGGGTPTLLSANDISSVLASVDDILPIASDAEISTECNPATADREKLKDFLDSGVNRLSIGVQSFCDDELKGLGRLHSAHDAEKIFSDARDAGFGNISLDLMYGIPGQTVNSWLYTVEKAMSLEPDHISAYALKVEPGTPFGKMGEKLILPSEDEVCGMYTDACGIFAGNGLMRYEISNFAKPGYESRHNLKYWHMEEYIGFGLAAHSFFGGVHFACIDRLEDYARGRVYDTDANEQISDNDAECEYVMLAMRLEEGLVSEKYTERFGTDPALKYEKRFLPYVKSGHVIRDSSGWHFSTEGMLVSNTVLSDILDL